MSAITHAQEDSIFQRFVVGPRSKQQMFWSTLGTLWIVWDLLPGSSEEGRRCQAALRSAR